MHFGILYTTRYQCLRLKIKPRFIKNKLRDSLNYQEATPVDNDLELECLLFEEEENQTLLIDQEFLDKTETISERWASWVNVVNR